jgi:plastocyanin
MQFKLFNLLAFAPVALGKDMIPYIRIDMGKDDVPRFTPPSVTANVGDLLVFYWHGNHTIATSPFEKPCQYNKENYFFSGPYSNSKNGRLAFEVNVTTTYPIYFYCTVDENCHKAMVGGINLPFVYPSLGRHDFF